VQQLRCGSLQSPPLPTLQIVHVPPVLSGCIQEKGHVDNDFSNKYNDQEFDGTTAVLICCTQGALPLAFAAGGLPVTGYVCGLLLLLLHASPRRHLQQERSLAYGRLPSEGMLSSARVGWLRAVSFETSASSSRCPSDPIAGPRPHSCFSS